jgi:hypothetical protein
MRAGGTLAWLLEIPGLGRAAAVTAVMLLAIAAYPATGRAQVACLGPVSGPTVYCPDCIYDSYGEEDPDKPLDDFACGKFADLRPLGGNPNSDQYADPFVVEGDSVLESAMIRLRKVGIVPGDVVVRVWDDDDVLGNDNPEDPASFTDNRPGTVLARAVIPQAAMLCELTMIHQGSRCDVSASFNETPILEDGTVYWVGAAMAGALTSVSWVQTTGETSTQECTGVNCSEEWVVANTNGETPVWNAATNVDPVGLVRLVPEPSVALLRAGMLATLLVLGAVQRRRGLADSSANGRGSPS